MAENEQEKDEKKEEQAPAPEGKPKARKPFSFDQLKGGGKIHPQQPKSFRSRISRGSNRGR